MKNSILIVLATYLSLSGIAQDKRFKIAVHFDPNISWMKPDDKNITQGANKLKFGFGVMVDRMFSDNYAFGTGFNILHTGGQLTYLYTGSYKKDGASSSSEIIAERVRTYHLQYIEIPLTLKLRTNEIGYITYWAQMGVGLGFNIKAKADDQTTFIRERVIVADDPNTAGVDESSDTWETANIKQTNVEDIDVKDDIGIFRTSLIVAAGIEYNLSGDASIVAGFTFNNGFNDVLKNKGVIKTDSGNPDIYNKKPSTFDLKGLNNMLALNIGVLF